MKAIDAIRDDYARDQLLKELQALVERQQETIEFLARSVELLSAHCFNEEALTIVRDGLILIQMTDEVRH